MIGDNFVAGLDIGSDKVCAVVGQVVDRRFNILGAGVSRKDGVDKGSIVNIGTTFSAIIEAIDLAEQEAGVSISSVVVGFGGINIFSLNNRGVVPVRTKTGEISDVEIQNAIDIAQTIYIPYDRMLLHVIPQEFKVDNNENVKDPRHMIGQQLEASVHLITCPVTMHTNLMRCISSSQATFEVGSTMLNILASSNCVLSGEEKELGVLYIDMGAGITDYIVYIGGNPRYTGSHEYAGDTITKDISQLLATPFDSAESLKRNDGCCDLSCCKDGERVIIPKIGGRPPIELDRASFCDIISARVSEIFELIRKDLEDQKLLRKINGGVVLSGGGANLPGILENAYSLFSIPARLGEAKECTSKNPEWLGMEYLAAIGLARSGVVRERGSGKKRFPSPNGRKTLLSGLWEYIKEIF